MGGGSITIGDLVLATDPHTGHTAPKKVTHTWAHHDTVVDLVLADGAHLTTTEDHPFYNATDHQWQQAQTLDPGDHLLTPTGTTIPVSGLAWPTAHTDLAHNLTIADTHTYYVLAGNTPVLVHNTGSGGACGTSIANDLGNLPTGRQPHVRTVSSETELHGLFNQWSQGGTDITPTGFNGTRIQLSDGTIVQWRGASKSGGATIDLNIPGIDPMKIHIQ
jgi:hypothetical protein